MKALFNDFYTKNLFGFTILKPLVLAYQFFSQKKYLSRKKFILLQFKKNFGYELNLKNPKTLNEKINWLKLHYENPIGNKLADKYRVREVIKSEIGENYLIPLAYMTKNPKDIIPENLPNYPVIIKTNHNSSGGIVIKDKNIKNNWRRLQNQLRANLAENFYWVGRELVYKDIEPLIIVEKLLGDHNGNVPNDYKVHCFDGEVQMINVDIGRGGDNQYCNWYNKQWNREPYEWGGRIRNGTYAKPSEEDVEKPECLQEMIQLSQKLAKDFKYLRVDWYIINNKLYFGELTLYHHAGSKPIYPFEWDLTLGDKLILKQK
ncbi:glycosyl transferase [Muricauda sp. TY007]|uniref:ATP-grasp fold amidoligase family protein n=1 Tax=Allomuricauda sp. TY007 TaxID=2683200 RepID=UPI0013BF8AB3|nr:MULTISPECIES: ATP-grasp fold amidoligase family protein [unclassified Allomuricauda]MBA4744723.1 glycosyl transferase [Allomuricauda sp.]NDV17308.1 glycosyl transferase [Muricauda sp. TY007]